MCLDAAKVNGADVIEGIGAASKQNHAVNHHILVEGMDLPTSSFDLALCFATMEHVPRIAPAFAEVARVTAPGAMSTRRLAAQAKCGEVRLAQGQS